MNYECRITTDAMILGVTISVKPFCFAAEASLS